MHTNITNNKPITKGLQFNYTFKMIDSHILSIQNTDQYLFLYDYQATHGPLSGAVHINQDGNIHFVQKHNQPQNQFLLAQPVLRSPFV